MYRRPPGFGVPRGPPVAGRGRRSGGFYALMLAGRLIEQIASLDRKPPLTLALIGIMCVLHFGIDAVEKIAWPALGPLDLSAVCFNPTTFPSLPVPLLLKRSLFSVLTHADDLHLLYNMLSFVYKGVPVETILGTPRYAALLTYLALAPHAITLLLSHLARAALSTHSAASLFNKCAVGWSAVLFGLNIIIMSAPRYAQRQQRVFGLAVPARYVPWVELVLIAVLVPGTSFVGHLSGILAGLLWLYGGAWVALALGAVAGCVLGWGGRGGTARVARGEGRVLRAAREEEEEEEEVAVARPVEDIGATDGEARRRAAEAAARRFDASSLRRRNNHRPGADRADWY